MSSFLPMQSSSSLLNSPFSDQTHLQFYGDAFSSPSSVGSRLPSRKLKVALRAPLCNSSFAGGSQQATTQQSLMQELAKLKLQVEEKKKELKAHMKEQKKKGGVQKIESKEEKKSRKMAKKVMKAQENKQKGCSSDSSSSSESSDCECESISMSTMGQGNSEERDERVAAEARVIVEEIASLRTSASMVLTGRCDSQSHVNMAYSTSHSSKEALGGSGGFGSKSHGSRTANTIEVCTGGKCKKAGSEQLLLTLCGQIPGSSDVAAVPCKCMGKCAMAINVRVHKEDTNPQHHSYVGAEDAGLILTHHFGVGRPASGLPICPSMERRTTPIPAM